jgi:hypothetical protein
VEFIPAMYGKLVEHLTIRNCPLCSTMSAPLLRAYFVASMPRLRSFNDLEVTAADRDCAKAQYDPLLTVLLSSSGTPASGAGPTSASALSAHGSFASSSQWISQLRSAANSSNNSSSNNVSGNFAPSGVHNSVSSATTKGGKLDKKMDGNNGGSVGTSAGSLLKYHNQYYAKSVNGSGSMLGGGGPESVSVSSYPPMLAPQLSNGSNTAEFMHRVNGGGPGVPPPFPLGRGDDGPPPLFSFSQRAMLRRRGEPAFAEAFDSAIRKIIFETVADIQANK